MLVVLKLNMLYMSVNMFTAVSIESVMHIDICLDCIVHAWCGC